MDTNSGKSPLMTWKVHLASRNPARAASVIILILICVYFVAFSTSDIFLSSISAVVLILMVLPYYLPVTYILTDEGIIRKMFFSTQKRSWNEFHRYDIDKGSIKLYTMKQTSRLDNYRSFLLISNKNKEAIMEVVKKKIVPLQKDAEHSSSE
jgi:hypothetical protein